MDGQEAIALNIRLPAGLLEGLTRLVEQVRYLAAEINGGGGSAALPQAFEAGENPAFELRRFQEIGEEPEQIDTASANLTALTAPAALRTAVSAGNDLPIHGAGAEVSADTIEDPASRAQTAGLPEENIPAAGVETAGSTEDIAPFRSGPVSTPDLPSSAGFSVAGMPEASGGRWAGVTEELTGAADAPLTAQAVSQAFRRDGRRYDNGFPLY